jgi:IS5 family transposase
LLFHARHAGFCHGEQRQEQKGLEINWEISMKRGKLKVVSEDILIGGLPRQLASAKASIRSKVEHPVHVVKDLFHYRKIRCEVLATRVRQISP